MSGPIRVYQPQFSVPVLDAPRLKPLDVSSGLAAVGDAIEPIDRRTALERVEHADATAWAQKNLTELESDGIDIAGNEAKNGPPDGLTSRAMSALKDNADARGQNAPSDIAAHMFSIGAAEIAQRLQNSSMGLEADGRIAQRISDIGEGIGNAAKLAYDDPSRAAQLHARSQALLDGTLLPDQAKAQLRQQANAINESALRGTADRNPSAAVQQIDAGAWSKSGIDPHQLAAIRNNAALEQKRREFASTAAATLAGTRDAQEAQSLADTDVNARLTGTALDPNAQAKIKASLDPNKWSAYQTASANADKIFHAVGDLRTLPADKIQSALDTLKSEPELYQTASVNAARVASDRARDPAAAARDAFPDVQAVWQAYATSGATGDLQAALKTSQAAQTALGIPADQQRLVPADIAENEARTILNAKPDDQLSAYRALKARYATFAPALLQQIDHFFPPQLRQAAAQPSDLAGEQIWKQAVVSAGPDGPTPSVPNATGAALRPAAHRIFNTQSNTANAPISTPGSVQVASSGAIMTDASGGPPAATQAVAPAAGQAQQPSSGSQPQSQATSAQAPAPRPPMHNEIAASQVPPNPLIAPPSPADPPWKLSMGHNILVPTSNLAHRLQQCLKGLDWSNPTDNVVRGWDNEGGGGFYDMRKDKNGMHWYHGAMDILSNQGARYVDPNDPSRKEIILQGGQEITSPVTGTYVKTGMGGHEGPYIELDIGHSNPSNPIEGLHIRIFHVDLGDAPFGARPTPGANQVSPPPLLLRPGDLVRSGETIGTQQFFAGGADSPSRDVPPHAHIQIMLETAPRSGRYFLIDPYPFVHSPDYLPWDYAGVSQPPQTPESGKTMGPWYRGNLLPPK